MGGGAGGSEVSRIQELLRELDHGWTAEPVQRPQEEGSLRGSSCGQGCSVNQRGGVRVGEKHILASLLLLKVFHL